MPNVNVRIASVDADDQILDERHPVDHEMMDGASKASYTAYYPVFADWADSPESTQGKGVKSRSFQPLPSRHSNVPSH